MLVGGNADGHLEVWDLKSGTKTRSHKYDHSVEAVAFSADGKLLAAGDANRTVLVSDASTGAIVRTMKSQSRLRSLEFSPDASMLAAGTRTPGLELWNMRTITPARILKSPGDADDVEETRQGFVAFSPDGRFVVCAGHGKDIAVFDAAKGTLHCELRGHIHPAIAAAFLPDGRLISGGEERTVRMWEPNQNKLLATWIAVPADAAQNWSDQWIGFTPSGQFVSSTPSDRLVGWLSGGEFTAEADAANRRHCLQTLFNTPDSMPSTKK
jgi:WD40 repeat protein